jgi:hypothetical protein
VQERNEKWVAGILIGSRVHVLSFACTRISIELNTRRSPGAKYGHLCCCRVAARMRRGNVYEKNGIDGGMK